MDIKKYTPGDWAYEMATRGAGIPLPESIREVQVASVGRAYVTVADGWKTRYGNNAGREEDMFLEEKSDFGSKKLLFLTRKDALDYVEMYRLKVKLRRFASSPLLDDLTLLNLQSIMEIIEGAISLTKGDEVS